jgi:hypothetical protein
MLSQAELHERFEYRNGELFYKISPLPKVKVGSKAGSVNADGYVKVTINSKKYCAHRIIFMMQYGYLPKEVDHINCNRADNKVENLRAVSRNQNRYNIVSYKSNTSGAKGVSWKEPIKKWQVAVNVGGKRKYIGVFEDFELAELVAMEARHKYHGEYANNGLGA